MSPTVNDKSALKFDPSNSFHLSNQPHLNTDVPAEDHHRLLKNNFMVQNITS